jgi:hypothetical protein
MARLQAPQRWFYFITALFAFFFAGIYLDMAMSEAPGVRDFFISLIWLALGLFVFITGITLKKEKDQNSEDAR